MYKSVPPSACILLRVIITSRDGNSMSRPFIRPSFLSSNKAQNRRSRCIQFFIANFLPLAVEEEVPKFGRYRFSERDWWTWDFFFLWRHFLLHFFSGTAKESIMRESTNLQNFFPQNFKTQNKKTCLDLESLSFGRFTLDSEI